LTGANARFITVRNTSCCWLNDTDDQPMVLKCKSATVLIVAIDPGISQVGIAACYVNVLDLGEAVQRGQLRRFLARNLQWCLYDTVDLIQLVRQCDKTNQAQCPLQHSGQFVDRVDHLLNHFPIIARADFRIIEAQPPMGHVSLQNLLLKHFESQRDQMFLLESQSRNRWAGFPTYYTRMDRKCSLVQRLLLEWGYSALASRFHSAEQYYCLQHISHPLNDSRFFVQPRLCARPKASINNNNNNPLLAHQTGVSVKPTDAQPKTATTSSHLYDPAKMAPSTVNQLAPFWQQLVDQVHDRVDTVYLIKMFIEKYLLPAITITPGATKAATVETQPCGKRKFDPDNGTLAGAAKRICV
jgi:hypothetical protein